MRKYLLLIFFLFIIVLPTDSINAQRTDQLYKNDYSTLNISFASLVKKYKDGYLISVLPKTSEYDFVGLEKYLERIPPEPQDYPDSRYLAIDEQDYEMIEKKYNFYRTNKLSIWGSWGRGNYIARGESYYLICDMLGIHNEVENVYVFVKGNESLNKIQPVWAKNYHANDMTFTGVELRGRTVTNFYSDNTVILSKCHEIVLKQLQEKATEDSFDFSIIDEVSEFKEEVYEVKLLSGLDKQFLIIVNGLSHIKNIKFCMALLITSDFKIIDEIIPMTILKTDIHYYYCSFTVDHIYYSEDLNRDLVIGTHRWGMGGDVFLITEKDGNIEKTIIFSWHGC